MASENVHILNESNFESTIKDSHSTPVLVDFWAPWCGPCKAIAPIIDELANDMKGKAKICKVDVDQNQDIAARFNIRTIPTLAIFKNGAIVDQVVGVTGKNDLVSKLNAFI